MGCCTSAEQPRTAPQQPRKGVLSQKVAESQKAKEAAPGQPELVADAPAEEAPPSGGAVAGRVAELDAAFAELRQSLAAPKRGMLTTLFTAAGEGMGGGLYSLQVASGLPIACPGTLAQKIAMMDSAYAELRASCPWSVARKVEAIDAAFADLRASIA